MFSRTSHALLYHRYRFQYPKEVYDVIIDFVTARKTDRNLDQAVDVGCGTGVSTRPLAPFFRHVIGVDISKAQIKVAKDVTAEENVTFKVGDCYKLPVEDESCELVTSAASVHWFDEIDRFYSECNRVLRLNGSLVVYTYNGMSVQHPTKQDQLNRILAEFNEHPKLAELRSPNTLPGFFNNFRLPYNNSSRTVVVSKIDTTTASLAGFWRSLSWYQLFLQKYPYDPDPVKELMLKLNNIIDDPLNPGNCRITLAVPVTLFLGRKC